MALRESSHDIRASLPAVVRHNGEGREARMKKFVWFIGGMAAAAAGFLVWSSTRSQAIHEPAYYLDEDASDSPTFV